MTSFELDEDFDGYTEEDKKWEETMNSLPDKLEIIDAAINKLVDQVARLANKLDEHMKESDAHNPAILRGGVSFKK